MFLVQNTKENWIFSTMTRIQQPNKTQFSFEFPLEHLEKVLRRNSAKSLLGWFLYIERRAPVGEFTFILRECYSVLFSNEINFTIAL